ncbi:GntR family transcriptional regulator [Cohnella xylanilytica]|uniref:GntR family transcriptional regulator n=1 Tax=Cohnella TaxID=329857 RepID=UPI0015931252|nr:MULTISPECIES: GntR family transcriptional regulator [Cohnella]MBN2980196.1 GntR family transcriptional regulator [Cohnella algarum]GIO15896.1 GntR family transcriptional regulator [Cohnella xylanilytica]
MKNHTAPSRVAETRRSIIAIIREERFEDGGRLPSEGRIAGMLGVSRATVRAALGDLEAGGLIHRRHGLGTFVNPVAARIHARLDAWVEFKSLIENSGFAADIEVLELEKGPLPPDLARTLNAKPGEASVTVRKLFTADGKPAILCRDIVPLSILPGEGDISKLKSVDTFRFLTEYGLGPVAYGVASLVAKSADGELSSLLGLPEGTPLLSFENIGYAQSDVPLFASSELYCPGLIDFGILRRHLY